ncbi:MAG: xanthan lyase [Bacteroidales bacterium]
MKKIIILLLLILCESQISAKAESTMQAELNEVVTNAILSTIPSNMGIGFVEAKDVTFSKKTVNVDINETYSYLPITESSIEQVKSAIKSALGEDYDSYKVELTVDGIDIETYLIKKGSAPKRKKDEAFITPYNKEDMVEKGLQGEIIAMWQSHGWYFESSLNRWEWQRARIFQTVEDLYTQSYVVPYIMPMLENAGATVISPRERDVNTNEVIVDNDKGIGLFGSRYVEKDKVYKWESGSEGFANFKKQYTERENPFREGTYRVVKSINNEDAVSTAKWYAKIPEDGKYAVYISYKSLDNSAEDAIYTINSEDDTKKIYVNQKMGGGTWIYIGHFQFKKGLTEYPVVELSNYSKDKKSVITADAVKIGGGYGNIARRVTKETALDSTLAFDYKYQVSKYPRFTEAGRYWLQWAGVPDSVYSPMNYTHDYKDDYQSRGLWVNYMAGGSSVLPDKAGLGIPVDLAFAFHSDAGTTINDSIIGTLGIYFTDKFNTYKDGTPRLESRKLTDYIMTNIVNDVRAKYNPEWTRRGMWDKSYFEARTPEVPTMLLELLSHQNFADMKFGLDPRFRFDVSRAIYKGMLQFLAERDGRKYQVQPLPVNSFAIEPMASNNKFRLSWLNTHDTLSEDADASKYYIYERVEDGGFKKIAETVNNEYVVTVDDNKIRSYKIVAVNDGGLSFPSEILSLGVAKESKGVVMVINGFTRVSAPDWFESDGIAGFYDAKDHGVPDGQDISFIGSQFEYRRDIPWMDDDAAGFGASRANYEDKVIAGNTFDFPSLHGKAIMKAGLSFVSTSRKAVENNIIDLRRYSIVDLIMGNQKEVPNGTNSYPSEFKTFTPELQNAIKAFCSNGGSILVTGSFVGSDIWDKKSAVLEDMEFAEKVLGYKWRVDQATAEDMAYTVQTKFNPLVDGEEYRFSNELNDKIYAVDSPDALVPANNKTGYTFMRYGENNIPAAVVTDNGEYRTCIIGFPFETIKGEKQKNILMKQIMNFLQGK